MMFRIRNIAIFFLCFNINLSNIVLSQTGSNILSGETSLFFTVIKVRGKVINTQNKETLKPLSKFSEKDTLSFDSKDALLALIDMKDKAYIAAPQSNLTTYTLRPISAKWNIRPGTIISHMSFQRYLSGTNFLILGGQVSIELGGEFVMDDQHFFYIRYNWKEETINKKLSYSGNRMIINKEELYKVDGQPIKPEEVKDYVLYYYNIEEETSVKIGEFTPVFPNEEVLREEIRAIIQSDLEAGKIRSTIEDYLFDQYGVPEKENLNIWLKKNFNL